MNKHTFVSLYLVSFLFIAIAPLMAQQAQLAGIISNRYESLEGVDIALDGTTVRAKTEADGSFEISAPAGTYTLRATRDGYVPLEQTVTLDPARPLQKILTMESRFDATLNPEVVTATRSSEYVFDAPATVYVITDEQIATRGYVHLQDILEDIPEVEIQRNSNEEFRDFISMRGISGNEKFMILLDGVQISVPTGEPTYVGRNYSVLSAKRVEVILGPASALYGVDAFAGVINIVTQDGSSSENSASAQANYGRFNTLELGGNLNLASKNALTFSATGYRYTSDEVNYPKFYPEEFSWYNNQYLPYGNVLSPFALTDTFQAPAVANRSFTLPSEAHFAHARLSWRTLEAGVTQHYTQQSSSYGVYPQFTLYNEDAIYGSTLTNSYLRHTARGGEKKKWELSSLGWYSAFRALPNQAFINNYSGFKAGYKYQESNTFRLQEVFTLNLAPTLNVAVGLQADHFEAIAKTADLAVPFQQGVPAEEQGLYYIGTNVTDKNGNSLQIPMQFFRPTYNNYAAYGQVRWSDKKEIAAVTAGLRMDYNTSYGPRINPRVGLVLTPIVSNHERLKIKAMYGEAFLAPSPWKAESHFGSFSPQTDSAGEIIGLTAGFWHLPNYELEPEKLRSAEISLISKVGQGLLLSLNGYYVQINNLITQFGFNDPATGPYPGNIFNGVKVGYIEMTVNQGTQVAYGTTLRANYVHDFGLWTFETYGSYTFANGRIYTTDTSSIDQPFTAHHTIKAGLSLSNRRFSISPRVVARTRTFGNGSNVYNEVYESPAFAVVNLHTQYRMPFNQGKQWIAVYLRINNLLDSRYYNVFFGGSTGFGAIPQDPFRWNLGLKIDL